MKKYAMFYVQFCACKIHDRNDEYDVLNMNRR